jgi:hypothetical protein
MPEICELCGENINGYGHGVDCPERTAAIYLIERSQPEGQFPTMWWMHALEWTEDANKATRFDTRTAAEAMLEKHSGIKGVHRAFGHVTPHLWLNRDRADEPRGGASSSGSAPEPQNAPRMP